MKRILRENHPLRSYEDPITAQQQRRQRRRRCFLSSFHRSMKMGMGIGIGMIAILIMNVQPVNAFASLIGIAANINAIPDTVANTALVRKDKKRIVNTQNRQLGRIHVPLATTTLAATSEEDEKDPSMNAESTSSATQISTSSTSSSSSTSRRFTVITTLVGGLLSASIAAKIGILNGPVDTMSSIIHYGTYTDAMILRDVGATALATVLALLAVKIIGWGYEQDIYSSKVSRKLSHTLLAPAFIMTYPMFSAADGARCFAAVVTIVNAMRLYLAATGEDDSSLARQVSRSGDKAEALGGPFIYVCLLSLFILGFWRSSPIGIVASSTMAAGDGMADLVGRQLGKNNKWWFSESKSVAGTVAFAISATLVSLGLLNWLQYTGCLQMSLASSDLTIRVVIISVICSFVELLPFGDDNYSVPLSAGALAALLLK